MFPSTQEEQGFMQMQQNLISQMGRASMIERLDTGDSQFMQRPGLEPQLPRPPMDVDIDTAEFASELRGAFQELGDTAGRITPPDTSIDTTVFDERAGEVEDEEVLQAQVQEGARLQEFQVEVEELAREQVEETAIFREDDEAGEILNIEGEEEFAFTIEQEGIEETFRIDVEETDEMRDVLDRIAREIDEAEEVDVGARVVDDAEDLEEDEVFLELTAGEAGEAAAFEIEDEDGELIEELELDTVQEARDAEVDIEGREEGVDYRAEGDRIIMDEDRVELTLEEPGETMVEITPDVEAIREGVEDFVETYGEALDFIEESITNDELSRVGDRLTRAARSEAFDLSRAGIDVDDTGRLIVMEETLEGRIEEDPGGVQEALGDFAARVERTADDVLTTPPSRFMDEPEETDLYTGYEDFQLFDQMGDVSYPQSMPSGMFFDFVF